MNTNRPSRTPIMEKALLKVILPFVAAPQDHKSPFLLLGRVSAITFNQKSNKEKKPKCRVCGAVYENYLLFVLHIELIHSNQIQVQRYEFTQDLLLISYVQLERSNQKQQKYLQTKGKSLFLLQNHQTRIKEILSKISVKFVKKYIKQKQQYFHSYDIFKEIRPESDGQDSEDDVAYIQRELQKLRIGEFTDINEQDKLFFINWNKAIHQARKIHVILSKEEIIEVLTSFAITAKKQGLKRLNLVMHGWTLFSSGIINSRDINTFLQCYDDYE